MNTVPINPLSLKKGDKVLFPKEEHIGVVYEVGSQGNPALGNGFFKCFIESIGKHCAQTFGKHCKVLKII